MKIKNTVHTLEEYMGQGFSEKEAPIVRKTDIMFNRWEELSEKEKEHYYAMCKWLGL